MFDLEKLRLTKMVLNELLENRKLLREIEELKLQKEELEKQLSKDKLTGLYNREIAEEAYLKTKTVIMCDIDDFKILNDTYGHNFGDIVLKRISDILKDSVRDTDYVIRWGGEEFVIFIDNHNLSTAEKLAERIRNKVETLEGQLLEDGTKCPKITMSFGVTRLHSGSTLDDDIDKADAALYASKRNGKNSVTVSEEKLKTLAFVKRR